MPNAPGVRLHEGATPCFAALRHCRRSFVAHSSARTYIRLLRAPTCFVTVWQLPCFALGRRWKKLEKFFDIETPTQRKSTPRSTSMACAHWLTPGRWEVHSEALEQALNDYIGIRRSSWIPTPETGEFVTEFCRVSPSRGSLIHHHGIGTSLGHAAYQSSACCWAGRLGMVRRFAVWYSAIEPRTEIPPAGLLPHRHRRKPPHIYSDEEIEKLLRRTQQLPSPRDSVPARLRLSSVCWWQPECG